MSISSQTIEKRFLRQNISKHFFFNVENTPFPGKSRYNYINKYFIILQLERYRFFARNLPVFLCALPGDIKPFVHLPRTSMAGFPQKKRVRNPLNRFIIPNLSPLCQIIFRLICQILHFVSFRFQHFV